MDIVSNYSEGRMWLVFDFWIILYRSFGQGRTWYSVKLDWGENETVEFGFWIILYRSFGQVRTSDSIKLVLGENDTVEFDFWINLYRSFGQGRTWDSINFVGGETEIVEFDFWIIFSDLLDKGRHEIVSNYSEGRKCDSVIWLLNKSLHIFGKGRTFDSVKFVWGENESGEFDFYSILTDFLDMAGPDVVSILFEAKMRHLNLTF